VRGIFKYDAIALANGRLEFPVTIFIFCSFLFMVDVIFYATIACLDDM